MSLNSVQSFVIENCNGPTIENGLNNVCLHPLSRTFTFYLYLYVKGLTFFESFSSHVQSSERFRNLMSRDEARSMFIHAWLIQSRQVYLHNYLQHKHCRDRFGGARFGGEHDWHATGLVRGTSLCVGHFIMSHVTLRPEIFMFSLFKAEVKQTKSREFFRRFYSRHCRDDVICPPTWLEIK